MNDETTEIPHPTPDLEPLLDELRREATRRRKLVEWQQVLKPLGCIITLTFFSHGFAREFHWSLPLWYFILSVSLLIIGMVSFLPALLIIGCTLSLRKKKIQFLVDKLSNDVRAVGPLAQLLYKGQEDSISAPVIQVLLRLLPRLQSNDARLLSATQMEALLTLLFLQTRPIRPFFTSLFVETQVIQREHSVPFAVLNALKQVGGRQAIAPVERLIAKTRDAEVREAAQETLLFLQAHAEDRDRAALLLLPSDVADLRSDVLLRPASSATTETPQEQLLRSVE